MHQWGCSGDLSPLTQPVSALQWRNGLIANGTWTLPMTHLHTEGRDKHWEGPGRPPQPLLCLISVSPLPDFGRCDKIPSFVPARNSLHLFLLSQLLLLCEEVEVYAKTACLGQGNTDLPVLPCYPSQAHVALKCSGPQQGRTSVSCLATFHQVTAPTKARTLGDEPQEETGSPHTSGTEHCRKVLHCPLHIICIKENRKSSHSPSPP